MQTKWIRFFIASAGAILLAAALERFLFAASRVPLSQPEALLGIPLRYAVLLVGVFELAVALICLFGWCPGLQLGCLAWTITNYAVYRIGLMLMNIHVQATCIGSYIDPLHLSYGRIRLVVAVLPLYLLIGSYLTMIWLWLSERRANSAKYVKIPCPSCGGRVKFATQNLGQRIPCPHCQQNVTLRRADENLKMPCFFCKGRIEFPAHALGQKLQCPHCAMDITLKEPATS